MHVFVSRALRFGAHLDAGIAETAPAIYVPSPMRAMRSISACRGCGYLN
jgi:hypothetical protein